ncbi:MAG: MMPL family transporter, partial [Thermoleophilia bacterium]|nr:MMPL family transporter [Thermoleophilia bacterium]
MSDEVKVGPIGRLGRFAARHAWWVIGVWAVVFVGLGILSPRAEHALSGAGWEASGSESVEARTLVQDNFAGNSSAALMVVLTSPDRPVGDPAFRAAVTRVEGILRADDRVASVTPPQPGQSISPDGRTAVVMAGAAGSTTEMVRAADDLKGPLERAGGDEVTVALTGASGMWSDFNQANKEAMLKSEVMSWPVTLAILLLAFGALVAAGLPLMLTIVGLVSSAGVLWMVAQAFDVSIWAMNFALMFALALGIDYALFVVVRFRAALFGSHQSREDAVATTMDTAGKAVLFSGLTVLISLTAVMLVPSPAFRSMSLGIMLSVIFVLLATLTLLPAVLMKLGQRVNRLALPWVHQGEHRSARFAAWGERLWRRPARYGIPALVALVVLAVPVLGLDTGMPSIKVVPESDGARIGYVAVQEGFGVGAPGALQIVGPAAQVEEAARLAAADPGIARVSPVQPGADGLALVQAIPREDPSDPAVGATIDALRTQVPEGVLIGGATAENHDLEQALADATPIVIGVVLALGFLLLLVAFQAPLVALIGVATNLLATAAAFGVARLVFQEGWLSGVLGFESQGFLNAWGPVFFFAMIFAIS